jgi:hypothetical protein
VVLAALHCLLAGQSLLQTTERLQVGVVGVVVVAMCLVRMYPPEGMVAAVEAALVLMPVPVALEVFL